MQMTRTIPLRRTILQFSQIRLTLALTFMASLTLFGNVEWSSIANRMVRLKGAAPKD